MPLEIDPPLINSANPWATTIDDLIALYNCPYTGAVTIRTCLLQGFPHDPKTHQYIFFNPSSPPDEKTATIDSQGKSEVLPGQNCSLNTLGYSYIQLHQYISAVAMIQDGEKGAVNLFPPAKSKPFIFSVTGTAEDICYCYELIWRANSYQFRLYMEVNLSCPNIPDKPPPAYDSSALDLYLLALSKVKDVKVGNLTDIPPPLVGIKTPPYTYQAQYDSLLHSLKKSTTYPGGCPISFITSTNTLGSCLVLTKDNKPALSSASGTGIGGLAGPALHPLALGNVATIRRMLDQSEEEQLKRIEIIGIGGVSDRAGFDRMRAVGAAVVGVGTALGREGLGIFKKILVGDEKSGEGGR